MLTDLENDLCAALDALPASRNAAENIGQRLGVSAPRPASLRDAGRLLIAGE